MLLRYLLWALLKLWQWVYVRLQLFLQQDWAIWLAGRRVNTCTYILLYRSSWSVWRTCCWHMLLFKTDSFLIGKFCQRGNLIRSSVLTSPVYFPTERGCVYVCLVSLFRVHVCLVFFLVYLFFAFVSCFSWVRAVYTRMGVRHKHVWCLSGLFLSVLPLCVCLLIVSLGCEPYTHERGWGTNMSDVCLVFFSASFFAFVSCFSWVRAVYKRTEVRHKYVWCLSGLFLSVLFCVCLLFLLGGSRIRRGGTNMSDVCLVFFSVSFLFVFVS